MGKIETIKKSLGIFAAKSNYFFRKNGPAILTTLGIIAPGVAIVTSSFAGVKANEIIKLHKSNIEVINGNDTLDKKTRRINKFKVYSDSSFKLLSVYAPTLFLYMFGVGATLSSSSIMKQRNAALAASYAAIQSQLMSYRDRVKEAIGEEEESKIFGNVVKKKRVVKDKDGNEVVEEYEVIEPEVNDYMYLFDETTPCWSPNPRNNLEMLLMFEDRLTEQLTRHGFLFMEDVWKLLGVERSQLSKTQLQEARVVGWIYDRDNPNGDNRVSFGLRNKDGSLTEHAKGMLRRCEPGVMLVFNPDGDIVSGNVDKKTGVTKRTYAETAKF